MSSASPRSAGAPGARARRRSPGGPRRSARRRSGRRPGAASSCSPAAGRGRRSRSSRRPSRPTGASGRGRGPRARRRRPACAPPRASRRGTARRAGAGPCCRRRRRRRRSARPAVPTVVARLAPSSVAVRSSTRTPCSTATPSSASRSRSTCSTRHCGISRVDGQGVSLVAGWSPRATSSNAPSRRWRRIGSVVRPRETSRSVTPAVSSSSSERGCSPLPRDPGNGAGAASSTRTATPRRASSRAAVSPVGPAPTTITSASMDATLRRSETESQLVLSIRWVAVPGCPV